MFQYVEGPCVVLGGVTRSPRALPECIDGCTDGVQWYMSVGVDTTQPTDEVTHFEIKEEV